MPIKTNDKTGEDGGEVGGGVWVYRNIKTFFLFSKFQKF